MPSIRIYVYGYITHPFAWYCSNQGQHKNTVLLACPVPVAFTHKVRLAVFSSRRACLQYPSFADHSVAVLSVGSGTLLAMAGARAEKKTRRDTLRVASGTYLLGSAQHWLVETL